MPDEQHATYWEFAIDVIADVAADLVGPDVVFHHSKLNFKWDEGTDDVKWHQDIQFYPHTNYSRLVPDDFPWWPPAHRPRRCLPSW